MFNDVAEEVPWGPHVQILIIKWCFPPKRGSKCPSYCSESQNDGSSREKADFSLDREGASALTQTQETRCRAKFRHPPGHWGLWHRAMCKYWGKTKTQLCPPNQQLMLHCRPDHLQQKQRNHPDRRDAEPQAERELALHPWGFGILTRMSQETLENKLLPYLGTSS